jgi:hypothetical protein
VAATAASALLATLTAPIPDPTAVGGVAYWVALAFFVLVNVLVSVLSEQLHRARWEAAETAEAIRRSDVRRRRLFESNIIGVLFWTADGGGGARGSHPAVRP